ncbi:MAG: radical SAM protein [Desulfobulbaceae bacterium]|nr:radical SAM protein [Desulfobulbaceae bacterium]
MAGMAHEQIVRPATADLIELPEGSELFVLPGRLPVGTDPATGEPLLLEEHPGQPGKPILAVAAFMAPAHTALYTAAYQRRADAPLLPLFAYTAVGWHLGRFWVTGFRSDSDQRQDARNFRQEQITRLTQKLLKRHRDNRLIQHLGICCLTYHCPAARNYFLGRWEAPLPSSPICNARCLGCISLQESGCCPSTQDRIAFVPSSREICEIAVPHLQTAPSPIVSFGQGCEGEPLLQANLLATSIQAIRRQTTRGTINCNSNASLPDAVDRLARAGLDSLRVSLNSARASYYEGYYRPRGYRFADVRQSIRTMKKRGKFVSLNYFILPGFTDTIGELEALADLVQTDGVDYIQLRNLNIDPHYYFSSLAVPAEPGIGLRHWLTQLKTRLPHLRFGYFNPQVNADR